MLKKVIALLSALLLAASCVACQTAPSSGESGSPDGSEGSEANGEQIVLEMPHWFFGHGEAIYDWITEAVAAYEDANPNIKIDGYEVAYSEFWDKMDTSIASGTAADLLALTNTNLSKYIDAGSIIALDDYIDMEDIANNWSDVQKTAVVDCGTDGKTYMLITDMGYYLPMYRPSIFEKAGISEFPTTPEEFIDAMTKLSSVDGVTPYAMMTVPGNYTEGAIDLSIWIIGLGGHYGENGQPTLNSPEVVEAFGYLKQMYDAGLIIRDTDKGTYRQMFASGNIGVLIDGQFMYPMLEGWDESVKGDYVVADLPFPTQRASCFFEGLSVSSTSEHPQEAADFIEYLCTLEEQQKLVDITGFASARADVFADEEFANSIYEKWDWMEVYADHLDDAVLNNPTGIGGDKLPELQKILYSAFESVLFEGADIQSTLDAAQEEALRIFD